MDISAVMVDLARRRPLFHSERDFQFALAWSIQQRYPHAELRLEPRPNRGIHLDLLVHLAQRRIAIEVRYLVAAFGGALGVDRFDLPNQGAHDVARHDVVKDLVRLERLLSDGYADEGVGLTLTNDSAYWRPGMRNTTIDAAFRIHEGRTLNGALEWSPTAGAGTTHKRDVPLTLAGSYTCAWHHFANVAADGGRVVELRYLTLPVREPGRPTLVAAVVPQVVSTTGALTARDEILLAVADILRRSGRAEFDLSDVLAEMRQRGSRYAESTIRTHVVSRMCANAPDHHATTFDDFENVGRGRYRLRR
ncbi:hypothetical protein AB0K00_40170 [Dactylosporangium sp. NPDC049525]|uniref:DUF7669 domain-containing protein n=1 Tax=Dactylosporangium sp. NPDC049525 TaxID=3154730 RepID=UPI0034498720